MLSRAKIEHNIDSVIINSTIRSNVIFSELMLLQDYVADASNYNIQYSNFEIDMNTGI